MREPFMTPDTADERKILAMLDRMGTLVFNRDLRVVDELWSDAGFRLLGSEIGDRAETRAEVAAHMKGLFEKPIRVSWDWRDRKVTRHGDLAWICAEGDLVVAHADRTDRSAYRLVGIFQRIAGRWRWRLFSGSEPLT